MIIKMKHFWHLLFAAISSAHKTVTAAFSPPRSIPIYVSTEMVRTEGIRPQMPSPPPHPHFKHIVVLHLLLFVFSTLRGGGVCHVVEGRGRGREFTPQHNLIVHVSASHWRANCEPNTWSSEDRIACAVVENVTERIGPINRPNKMMRRFLFCVVISFKYTLTPVALHSGSRIQQRRKHFRPLPFQFAPFPTIPLFFTVTMAESNNAFWTLPFSGSNRILVLSVVLCSLFIPATTIHENGRDAPMGRRGTVKVVALRPRRALDMLESDDFGGFRKRALDLMDREGIGSYDKRALDSLEGDDFMGLKRKRALNALEGDGFTGLNKRALDVLDGDDFAGFRKRSEINGGLQRELALLGQIHVQRQMRTRRALDALEGNAFGFRR